MRDRIADRIADQSRLAALRYLVRLKIEYGDVEERATAIRIQKNLRGLRVKQACHEPAVLSPPRESVIYFATVDGMLDIGRAETAELQDHLRALGADELLGTVRWSREVESETLKAFARWRVGSGYVLSPAVWRAIRELCGPRSKSV